MPYRICFPFPCLKKCCYPRLRISSFPLIFSCPFPALDYWFFLLFFNESMFFTFSGNSLTTCSNKVPRSCYWFSLEKATRHPTRSSKPSKRMITLTNPTCMPTVHEGSQSKHLCRRYSNCKGLKAGPPVSPSKSFAFILCFHDLFLLKIAVYFFSSGLPILQHSSYRPRSLYPHLHNSSECKRFHSKCTGSREVAEDSHPHRHEQRAVPFASSIPQRDASVVARRCLSMDRRPFIACHVVEGWTRSWEIRAGWAGRRRFSGKVASRFDVFL